MKCPASFLCRRSTPSSGRLGHAAPRSMAQQQRRRRSPDDVDLTGPKRPGPVDDHLPTTASFSASSSSLVLPRSLLVLLTTLLVLSLFCGSATAAAGTADRQRSAPHSPRRLARRVELLIDRSEPPAPRMRLHARDGSSSSASTDTLFRLSASSTAPASTGTDSPSSTTASTTASIAAATSTSTSLPQPFDTNLGNNFTETSCPAFFQAFLNNQTFVSCLPFSLLLQTSKGFFDVSKSLVRVTQTLDASCNVDLGQCSALMETLAWQLRLDSNCGQDYRRENPLVRQAYNGLVSYRVEYDAGCTKDQDGSYCFANAITNTTSPSDAYIYYLPLDNPLTGGSRPTCNRCLEKTMDIFTTYAGNATQPISHTYGNAASTINLQCGPGFANSTVAVSGATPRRIEDTSLLGLATLAFLVGSFLW